MAEQDFLSSVLGEGVELTPSQKVNIDLSDSFDAIPYNNIVDYVVLDRWSLANPNNPNEVIKIDPTGLEAMRRDGMTDDEILMRFANFRDKNAAQRFLEEGAKAFATAFPSTALGIRTGRQFGGLTPAGILGGTTAGFSVGLATDLLRSQMFPSTNIPYLPNTEIRTVTGEDGKPQPLSFLTGRDAASRMGEVFGGGAGAFNLPWLMKDATITLGSNFLRNNLSKISNNSFFTQSLPRGLEAVEQGVQRGMETGLANPVRYGLTEGTALGGATAISGGIESSFGGETSGAAQEGLQVASEVGLSLLEPRARLTRYLLNKSPKLMNSLQTFNPTGRFGNTGEFFRQLIGAELREVSPDTPGAFFNEDANKYFVLDMPDELADVSFTDARKPSVFGSASDSPLNFENRTAAMQSGLPILYALEARRRTGATAPATEGIARVPSLGDDDIARRYDQENLELLAVMDVLARSDDPETLAIFSDVRDEYFRINLLRDFQNELDRYQQTVAKALESGEPIDQSKELYSLFFGPEGDTGLLGAYKRQEAAFKNIIPKTQPVNNSSLEAGVLQSYENIRQKYGIQGRDPKISSGRDLVYMDGVLDDLEKRVKANSSDVPQITPENIRRAEIAVDDKQAEIDRLNTSLSAITGNDPESEAAKQALQRRLETANFDLTDLQTKVETLKNPAIETKEDLNVDDLLKMLFLIDNSKKDALRSGNDQRLDMLAELERGAMRTLELTSNVGPNATDADRNASLLLDNYLSFRKGINQLFSGTFLGEMRSDIPPQASARALIGAMDSATLIRMQQLDEAANYLNNWEEGATGIAASALRQARQADPDIAPATPEEARETIVTAGDRALRGILDNPKYFRSVPRKDEAGNIMFVMDAEGNLTDRPQTMLEPTQTFRNFMADPVVNQILDDNFPDLKADLQDIETVNALFENLKNEQSNFNTLRNESDAFRRAFSGAFDDPAAGLIQLIGHPDQRGRDRRFANSVRDFTEIAKTAAESGDEQVKKGLINTVIQAAFDYGGGNAGTDRSTKEILFNPDKMLEYLNSPMSRGTSESVGSILVSSGVLENEAHLAKINSLLRQMSNNLNVRLPGRQASLPDLPEESPIEGTRRTIEEVAGRTLGAGVASASYRLLRSIPGFEKIFGAAASLVISSLGARQGERAFKAARFTEQELLKSALKDPLLLDVLLRTPTRELKEFSVEELRPVYGWLYGSGVIPAQYTFQDFFQEAVLGRGQEEREAREEAIRTRGGQPSGSPVATPRPVPPPQVSAPQPVAPPPVAQAPMPMPQAPAPTAPASPASRQQFAAAFPFDVTSDVIRSQGIGSLGRTG
jgi:hypothetical protein